MQKLQRQRGFTLIEMMVVVAIIAIVSATAAPYWQRYQMREDARANAQNIAKAFSDARSQARSTGLNHFVIFNNPVNFAVQGVGDAQQIGNIVRDIDGNFGLGPADTVTPIYAAEGTHPQVSPLIPTSPFRDATLAPEDAQSTDPFFATLDQVAQGNGTSFPNAPFNFAPSIGFNSQGIPVDLNTPAVPGSGAGAFYVTDNNSALYAVVLLPLGGVRVRVLNPAFPPVVWQ